MKPHPYNLTVVAIDAVSDDYESFFGPLVSEKSITDINLPKGKTLLDKIKNAISKNKPALIQELNEYLKQEYVILPLYQEVRTFYFPKYLKGIKVGKDNLEYPRVSEIDI